MTNEHITQMSKELFREERARTRLDGWFFIKQLRRRCEEQGLSPAEALKEIARELPLSISKNAMFAGTQRDAFARSYALINPTFEVESFAGYCDPTAVFNDIEPGEGITQEQMRLVIVTPCKYTAPEIIIHRRPCHFVCNVHRYCTQSRA